MKNVFNHFYKGYDNWYHTPVGQFVDKQETTNLLNLLQPNPQQKILEVGCGTGHFTFNIAQKGCRVEGIDQASNMLKQAEDQLSFDDQGQVLLKKMDAQNLSYEDCQFDSAFSMASFEFIADPQRAYQQMYRVIKPGGTIVLGTIQKNSAWANFYESSACHGTAYEYAKFLTLEQVKNWDARHFLDSQQCLFLPPNLPEADYTEKNEKQAQKIDKIGGFVCLKFRKSAVN